MTDLIGIVTTIIYIVQLIATLAKPKFHNSPFMEYENMQSKYVAILATFLWKVISFIVFGIMILVPIYEMFIFKDSEDYQTLIKKIYICNILIVIASGFIKDIFHNVILYKDWFVMFFKNHSPTKDFLKNITGADIVVILLTCSVGAGSHDIKIVWICDIILMCVMALSFCLYRVVAEAEDLIYIHKVSHLKIKMSDGKEYDKITYYHEDKKTVCIGDAREYIRYYLNKDHIVCIEKRINEKSMIDELSDGMKT